MPEQYIQDQELETQDGDGQEEVYAESDGIEDADAFVEKYDLGCYAPWWYSPERTYLKEDLDADIRGALITLRQLASRSDVAARRFEVEQAWESKLFLRGYQHLEPRKGGGFSLPGEDTRWGPTAQINRSNLLNTNIYSKTHDILVGALCRETPRVQFLPANPDFNPEVTAAQTADKYKLVYQRNNNLKSLHRDIASYFCTDDRVVLLTGFFLDGSNLGFEEDDEEPVSPETETSSALEQVAQEVQEAMESSDEEAQEAPEQEQAEQPEAETEEAAPAPGKRSPKGMERTMAFDKLSAKVPITSTCRDDMVWVGLFADLDEAYVRAMFPFAKDRINAEGSDSAELELDRIARMNTNLAIQGKYVTGDSMQRFCTVSWYLIRPSFFYAKEVKQEIKGDVTDKLCEMFPDGVLLASAGSELMFARNCSMNDHVTVGHAFSGNGQNRRALLTSIIPVQKRLNTWMDLMGDFFVRTVPKRYYDQTAFDIELIQSQDNVPGGAIPFLARAGQPVTELMGTDPIVQNQPAMAEFIKWFEGELNDDLSGALASLYGGAIDQNTVGGAEIQRDQALGRLNSPWNAIQEMFAESHRQAVKAAAQCRKRDVDDMVPGSGRVTFEIAKMKGNVLCYPEYDASFPESSTQKQSRYEELWKTAPENPFSAALLKTPKNMKVAKDVLRFHDLEIPGAAEYEKQEGEFQILIKTGPIPNPEITKLEQGIAQHEAQLKQATQGMAQDVLAGTHKEEEIQQAAPMLDQLEQQVNMMKQQLQKLQQDTPLVSTVPVAQDKSENHAIEAAAVYDWMNSPEGRRFKHGSPEEMEVFQNFYLHWKEHTAMDAQLNPPSADLKSTGESLSIPIDKMPPNVAIQALAKVGITATPEDFQQKSQDDTKKVVQERTAPHVIRKLTRS